MFSNESSASLSSALEAIVARLAQMEARLSTLQLPADGSLSPIEMGSDERQDPAIVERAPPTDLHPPEDLFNSFIRCERTSSNVPWMKSSHSVGGNATKRLDQQLSNVQFRLSGVTRPIDSFLYDIFRNQSETVPAQLAVCVHEMLSDVASHISQLRSDNRLPSVPLVPSQRDPGLLLNAPRIIEQTKLCQSLVGIFSS
ncbi:hypothetical protein [Parasitella parasitica]|uniref:Uncharacterized protein n=1 Tax=Parasitella parasitica TaxID=35722 RepID=A0A0B7NIR9_9FUNG|nr:hypothetical protein [Parasitella parasitica]